MKHSDDAIVSDDMVLYYHLMHPGGDSTPSDPNLAKCPIDYSLAGRPL